MLPRGAFHASGVEAFGMTRPANTVGGDFYDILPLPDGRVLFALGDVAGKGSPASLLMALLLAMMRTLVDEGFEGAALAARLNAQIVKHAPTSRFVTLFFGVLNTVDRRIRLRQRRTESAAGAARRWIIRAADEPAASHSACSNSPPMRSGRRTSTSAT